MQWMSCCRVQPPFVHLVDIVFLLHQITWQINECILNIFVWDSTKHWHENFKSSMCWRICCVFANTQFSLKYYLQLHCYFLCLYIFYMAFLWRFSVLKFGNEKFNHNINKNAADVMKTLYYFYFLNFYQF